MKRNKDLFSLDHSGGADKIKRATYSPQSYRRSNAGDINVEAPGGRRLVTRLTLNILVAAVVSITLWITVKFWADELPHPVYAGVAALGNDVLIEWVRYLAAPPTVEKSGVLFILHWPLYYLLGTATYSLAGCGLAEWMIRKAKPSAVSSAAI